MHVSVLKVQHHGSEHNLDEAFCRAITADHYVFCANGEYENPDPRVVEAIITSRIGSPQERSTNPQTSDPFTLWFNSNPGLGEDPEEKAHLEAVEQLVTARAAASNGQMRFQIRQTQSEDDPAMEVLL